MIREKFERSEAQNIALPIADRLNIAEQEMRARHSHDIEDRVALLPYAAQLSSLNDERALGKRLRALFTGRRKVVWQYWAQGADNAPDIVKACMRSVKCAFPGYRIVVLTEKNLSSFIRIPEEYTRHDDRITKTHFSDLLRVELLYRYGGIWIDATVLMTAELPKEIRDAPFFCFTRPSDPYLLSSWFMKADIGDPIVNAWRRMLRNYWGGNDYLSNYFLLHYLFEAAVTLNGELRTAWKNTPVLSSPNAHILQANLANQFDPHVFESITKASAVHKLTYKLPDTFEPDGTYYEHLLSR
ncbi:capsular polysaccharide synthesis protein [Agrobacterium salinitolerans]|uniref:capsular polysaccharide synthesis protein n=1 Tax=Agrobacterium salinitolerans TaxID=1183413 RepID=UPI0022B8248B|nr:capsular polysaccharide synthesis protein [Agrobacterium salinitolerans]MCZ7858543.1 capsular polysaccharide synthesis protein [Agrobacterium salinitolerans]